MLKPYLLIKQHLNGYNHKAFETVEEALAGVNHSDEFPGDYACVYNLSTDKYMHMEAFPGMDKDHIQEIINQYK